MEMCQWCFTEVTEPWSPAYGWHFECIQKAGEVMELMGQVAKIMGVSEDD